MTEQLQNTTEASGVVSTVDRGAIPRPVRIWARGGWLCNGRDGAINDWLMSDGTISTLSMREVEVMRHNSV